MTIVLLLFCLLLISIGYKAYSPKGVRGPHGRRRVAEPAVPSGHSLQRYQVMGRLLAKEDFDFLANQPGYTEELGRKLRSERRRIFRLYLDRLVRDFEQVYQALVGSSMDSPADRSAAIWTLTQQRFRFRAYVMYVRCQVVLHAFGVDAVEVHGLLQSMQTVQERLRRVELSPMSASS